jgi:hypothetical protein
MLYTSIALFDNAKKSCGGERWIQFKSSKLGNLPEKHLSDAPLQGMQRI